MLVSIEGTQTRKRGPVICPPRSTTGVYDAQLRDQPYPRITAKIKILQPGQQRMPHTCLNLKRKNSTTAR